MSRNGAGSVATSPPVHLSAPDVSIEEENALLRAFRSGWIAPLGPEVDAFEEELAEINQRRFCVALSSGTAALHLALLSHGVGPGDVVVTSTMTFAATVNAIVYTGATPVLVDCDGNGLLNPDLLGAAIAEQQRRGARVAAVVPVDLLGKVADHRRINEVATAAAVRVISDAAESLGACRDGRPSGAYGSAAVLSFNGNKIITTSGGGAVLTDDARVADRIRYLATQAREPTVHYEHHDVGYNYRLSNLLAGVGRAQLGRLPEMMQRRRGLRDRYEKLFEGRAGVTMFGQPDGRRGGTTADNCWLTAILIDEAVSGWNRDALMDHLAGRGIESRPLWKPMHQQPVFAGLDSFLDGTSDRLFEQGLSLPSGSGLDQPTLQRITDCIGDWLDGVAG